MRQFLIFILCVAGLAINTSAQEKVEVQKLKASHHTVYTDIIIEATPQQVWTVLTDTENFSSWGIFLTDIQGTICDSCEIDAIFQLNPSKEKFQDVHHTIAVEEGKEFRWSEKFVGGILDNHVFRVEPTADGKTRFIQSDMAKGGLTWLLGKTFIKLEAENYPIFNRALKEEVEKRYPR
ncbi:MAG: SRPBCC domain-containing protein [Bacteroidota bacterium]